MPICKNCLKQHSGDYGRGIFCSRHCQSVYNGRSRKNTKHTKETKERLSAKRSHYLATNPDAGGFKNVKWYSVKNILGESFIVRGLWEYNVALKLNYYNIVWVRNRYLNYFIDSVKKTYNPDFYLPDLDEYIEVKGYFSDKDKIKMDAVLDQNPSVCIRFIQQPKYRAFISDKITINDIPLYNIGDFNSGYKAKGRQVLHIELRKCIYCDSILKAKNKKFCSKHCQALYYRDKAKDKHPKKTSREPKAVKLCAVCGAAVPSRQTYCSASCANSVNKKIKITDTQKIELLKTKTISEIAVMYNISYNAVLKWKKRLLK